MAVGPGVCRGPRPTRQKAIPAIGFCDPPSPSRCIIGRRLRNTWTRASPRPSRIPQRRSAFEERQPQQQDDQRAQLERVRSTNGSTMLKGGLVTMALGAGGQLRRSARKSRSAKCARLAIVVRRHEASTSMPSGHAARRRWSPRARAPAPRPGVGAVSTLQQRLRPPPAAFHTDPDPRSA